VHRHVIAEALTKVSKTAESTRIAGVLATPRVSRNNVLYLPEQLAKNHGKTVVVDLEHNHDHTIGIAKLSWNSELQRLEYAGEIHDSTLEQQLKDGQEYHTSLEGGCQSTEVCGENKCYNACVANTNIERMALVLEPGIPESSVQIVERYVAEPNDERPPQAWWDACKATGKSDELCGYIFFHSLGGDRSKADPAMFKEDSSLKRECSCKSRLSATQPTKEMEECPDGQEWDAEAGKCVMKKQESQSFDALMKQDVKTTEELKSMLSWFRAKKAEESMSAVDPDSSLGKKANETITQAAYKAEERRAQQPSVVGKAELEQVVNPVIEQLKSMNKELADRSKVKTQPIAEVAPQRMSIIQEKYSKFMEFWNDREKMSMAWDVKKEAWLRDHDMDRRTGQFTINKTIKEAITATNVPAITFQNQILLDPTDLTKTAIRQFTNLVEAGEGTDLVNWYTGNAGSAGFEDQTVGTTFTDRTVTVTRQQAQLSKRVMGVKVGYYDVHDIPGGILAFVNEVIGLRAIADENAFIVGTSSGGFSESGFTPTNWVDGNDGTVISAENLASDPMKREGIVAAKRLIAAQGFPVTPGAQVTILAPQPYYELLVDTNLNNYYQFAKPEITTDAVLEMIYGSQIVVDTAIPFNDDTNDMWRNVMLTKGLTSGLGVQSGGGLEFEADRRNDVAQVFVSGRHRAVGKRILENSGCRISTTKT